MEEVKVLAGSSQFHQETVLDDVKWILFQIMC